MGSIIRLMPLKKDDRPVVPYRRIVSRVLYKRFLSSQRTMLAIDLIAALLLLPLGPLLPSLGTLSLASVAINFLYKSLVKPEPAAYRSIASEIYHKVVSKQLLAASAALGLPAYIYFVAFVAPATSTPQYSIKHFERFTDMDGIPSDWALHASFDMLAVNDAYIYGVSLAGGLAIAFSAYIIARDVLVFETNNVPRGQKGILFVLKQAFCSCFSRAITVWGTMVVIWPIIHYNVLKKHYLLFAPYLIRKAAQYSIRSLDKFEALKSLVILPLLLLPLVLLWSLSVDIFKLIVNTRPVSKWEFLSDFSPANTDSLLTGLSADPNSTTALIAWNELLTIAEHSKKRRKAIYDDMEGDSGAWKKIVSHSTNILHHHVESLRKKTKESAKDEKTINEDESIKDIFQKYATRTSIYPSITVKKTKQSIFTNPEPILNPNSALEKKIHRFVESLESRSTTRTERARIVLHRLYSRGVKYIRKAKDVFLLSHVGMLFLKSTARHLNCELRHRQTTAFAVHAVARLMTHSRLEDDYGNVQDTIAPFLASIDELSEALEHVIAHPPIDPSNVRVRKDIVKPNVTIARDLLVQLNTCFVEICEVFKPYFDTLNVNAKVRKRASRTDLTLADSAYLP